MDRLSEDGATCRAPGTGGFGCGSMTPTVQPTWASGSPTMVRAEAATGLPMPVKPAPPEIRGARKRRDADPDARTASASLVRPPI